MSDIGLTKPANVADYAVELPSGGRLHLQSPDEMDLWNSALEKYREDYILVKHNDLVALGALLQQQLILYRCQVAINGMEPQLDANRVPTGAYRRVEMEASELVGYQRTLVEAQKEMGRLEKQLGIDKATRESGGTHTLDNYLKTLKRAAQARGIHITSQVLEYQKVFKEASWKVRMLLHADPQDRAYHNITPKTVIMWLWEEIQRLEQLDQEFARETGKLYAGEL